MAEGGLVVGVDVVGESGADGRGRGGGGDAVQVGCVRDRWGLVGRVLGGNLVAERLKVDRGSFGDWAWWVVRAETMSG